jgi:predicted unusual protein kinase regulating ubiquinone biosynthesis (AarF/ABC1/UbiB family)
MMGQIQSITRTKLMRTFFGIAQKDANEVVNSLVELGALKITGDPGPIRRSVQYMLDNFMGGNNGTQPFEGSSIAEISDDLYEIAYDQPFRFPATFTFVMRALSTLEGLGKGLDPNFDFMEVAKPFALELMENGSSRDPGSLPSVIFGELGKQAAAASNSALSLPRKIEDTIEKLERGDIRLRVRSQESDRMLRRIGNVAIGGIFAFLSATFTLSATILLVSSWYWLAAISMLLALCFLIVLLRLLARLDRIERMF